VAVARLIVNPLADRRKGLCSLVAGFRPSPSVPTPHTNIVVAPDPFGPKASGARWACITEEGVERHAIGAVLVKLRVWGNASIPDTFQLLSSLHDLDAAFCTHTTQTTPPSSSITPTRPITTFYRRDPRCILPAISHHNSDSSLDCVA
jgi:hypothetical protein